MWLLSIGSERGTHYGTGMNALLPGDLTPERFTRYPPLARQIVAENIEALRRVPLIFLPNLLREMIAYDYKFPAEQRGLNSELGVLSRLTAHQIDDWFRDFRGIELSSSLREFDWINAPGQFVEQLSAHLWRTHQFEEFRQAAVEYERRLQAAIPVETPATPRLGIAVIGREMSGTAAPLFRKLRPHGVYFDRVQPDHGMETLLEIVAARAQKYGKPYAHWYIDGGAPAACDSAITKASYEQLTPARAMLLRRVANEIQTVGMGPETLRTDLAQLRPSDIGIEEDDPVLSRFLVSVLTEGSGTQIFSTTFVQWSVREALRRAQPMTVLARFAPRQRQRPMNELLTGNNARPQTDLAGSLVDADMGAYYNWINQQQLPGAEHSLFIAWLEGGSDAVVISPSLPRATQSSSRATVKELVTWAS